MKKIEVTEQDIRQALGRSGSSPLADALIEKLFHKNEVTIEELAEKIDRLEGKIRILSTEVFNLKYLQSRLK
jgi:hypothetical protein